MTTSLSKRDLILIAAGIGVLLVGQVADSAVNGVSQNDSKALEQAVARLYSVPKKIAQWESTSSELSPEEIKGASIAGYVRRQYRDPNTGYVVNLTILVGKSGPMAVHPPTACFEGIGYVMVAGPTPTTINHNDAASDFNKSSFRQSNVTLPTLVRVFWGWGTDGFWSAPENPRFDFRGQPYLYKMYVTDNWPEQTGRTPLPQIETFVQDALPTITNALNPNSSQPAAG